MIVETTAGKVEGVERAGVQQFRGIPYAWADRFRPSEPAQPWAGVLDATMFGSAAPQEPSATDTLLGVKDLVCDEDCLSLNVFTPGADDNARRPVLVWIHGGGFTSGSGYAPYYNASNLARQGDVVVVTINYRLGALGFLYLEHLVPDLAGSGANGIGDQLTALRWVRDNIADFGGDPGRVTLFGESAGAMSVGTLLGSPEAAGLFHGAIAQSGAAENVLTPELAVQVTDAVLAHLELPPEAAYRLLDLPVDAILLAQAAAEPALLSVRPDPARPDSGYLQLAFQPVLGGTLLPQRPLAAIRAGRSSGIPLVTGTTAEEWNLFALGDTLGDIGPERLRRRVVRLLGEDRADEAIALYRAARPEAHSSKLWCAMLTDRVFRMPAIRLAEAQLPHAPQVSMYRFDYRSTALGGLAGACHAIDVPFVFDNVDQPGVQALLGGIDDDTRRLSGRCARSWAAMAWSGQPSHDDLPWPAYEATRRATCILNRETTVLDDPEGEIRAFWQSRSC